MDGCFSRMSSPTLGGPVFGQFLQTRFPWQSGPLETRPAEGTEGCRGGADDIDNGGETTIDTTCIGGGASAGALSKTSQQQKGIRWPRSEKGVFCH